MGRPWTAELAAAAAGLVYVGGFAPFGLWPLSILALAVLFRCWHGAGRRRAARLGFLFGIAAFGAGVSWVYVSLHRYGNMELPLAALTVVLFVLLLALYPALAGWLQAGLGRAARVRLLVAMPAAWLLTEWLRGWLWSGFPWLLAGYSQIDTPMAALAPLAGVLGMTACSALSAGALALACGGGRDTIAGLAVAVAVYGGGALLGTVRWTADAGPPIEVAMVQRNVGLADKWAAGAAGRLLSEYLTDSLPLTGAELIVWPEAAWPGYLDEMPADALARMHAHSADFLFGAIERRRDEDGRVRYYNSAVAVSGQQIRIYRKRHLVPFGEYIPLRGLLAGLLGSLEIPMSDLSAWTGEQPAIELAGRPAAVTICYEDAFPGRLRSALRGAALLVNISEDAWFGDSLAPHQRLQMARMRAIESGRPMIRAGNNGLSALIDRDGRVTALAPQFAAAVVGGSIQPARGTTPWMATGDTPLVALVAAMLALLAWPQAARRRGRRPHTQ